MSLLILIEVVYGMHLNPRMEPQSLLPALHSKDLKMALGGTERSVGDQVKEMVQTLHPASFGSTRLKGKGFFFADVEEGQTTLAARSASTYHNKLEDE